MSMKKKGFSSSTAKPKASSAVRGSAHSTKKKSHTAGVQRTTVVQSKKTKRSEVWNKKNRKFADIGQMVKEAESWTELCICMKYIRDAAALVKCFNFVEDARFHHECLSGTFKEARKIALGRFSAAYKADAELTKLSDAPTVRKAYSAALHKWLLTKKITKKDRQLVMTHLAHYINQPKAIKTPFGTEALPVEGNIFGEGELRPGAKHGKMKPAKKRI